MSKWRYICEYEVIYPDIVIPGKGSLIGAPGTVISFEPPADGRWVPVEPPAPKKITKGAA